MKCINCFWFDRKGYTQINPILGRCRRYPPVNSYGRSSSNRYVIVEEGGWCGEYAQEVKVLPTLRLVRDD